MYAINQFKAIGVTPPKDTLIALLMAEEVYRLVVVDKAARDVSALTGQVRYYKRLAGLLALLVIVASTFTILGSVL